MTARYIAAIDQGTTSSRCIIFDASGALVASAQKEHRQIFPRPGWVEHDAEEIWRNVEQVVAGALTKAGAGPADLAGVGIGAWTGPRYRFTGQLIIPEAHAYLFKARAYVDQQGRFLQIDPIGQNGGLNIYSYAANDPVNLIDPSGEAWQYYLTCVAEEGPPPGPNDVNEQIANCTKNWVDEPESITGFGENFTFGGGFGGGGSGSASDQSQRSACHASSVESGAAKALGFGSDAQEGVTAAGKLAVWASGHAELADAVEWSLGPVGWGLAVAGEGAQVASDVAHGTRVDVALVGAGARLVAPFAFGAAGAAAGAPEGGIGAVPGGVIGTIAGAVAAPTVGRGAQAAYRAFLGC